MRKSSAIFVSAIALGLAMFVPLKASAQGVSIYIGPGYPAYGGYPHTQVTRTRLIRATMVRTAIPATATVIAVLTTAVIRDKAVA
jgi:hypothetical protein